MANTNVTLTAGVLPQGYCFTTLQQYYNDIIQYTLAELAGTFTGFNFGSNLPDPADQDKPWIRTNASGVLDRMYTWANGKWCAPNPIPVSSPERRIWCGSTMSFTDLWTYDGGDGTDPGSSTPTALTGAMWQVDSTFLFRFPVGAGTNPTAYAPDAATVIAPGGTGGEEKHVLTTAELAAHKHTASMATIVAGGFWEFATGFPNTNFTTNDTSTVGSDTAHNTMPPYIGVYFIKRTARQFYVV